MKQKTILAASLFLALVPLALKAQVYLQIDPSTPVPTILTPGQSFSFNLELVNATNPNIIGYSYALQSVNASQSPVSGIFSLTGLTVTSSVLSLANTNPLSLPTSLNPQVGSSTQPTDLGATTPAATPDAGLGIGNFDLETLTVRVNDNATLGEYGLEFYEPGSIPGPVSITDDNFNSVGTATGPFFSPTINLVPEPSTWALLLTGGGLFVFFRRLFKFRFQR